MVILPADDHQALSCYAGRDAQWMPSLSAENKEHPDLVGQNHCGDSHKSLDPASLSKMARNKTPLSCVECQLETKTLRTNRTTASTGRALMERLASKLSAIPGPEMKMELTALREQGTASLTEANQGNCSLGLTLRLRLRKEHSREQLSQGQFPSHQKVLVILELERHYSSPVAQILAG